jgi:hypothetical protein
MSAAAGLSATAGEGQKLWTTLLLGLTDIILTINIWGHARDQTKAAQAKADSKAAQKQVGIDQPARDRLFGSCVVRCCVALLLSPGRGQGEGGEES